MSNCSADFKRKTWWESPVFRIRCPNDGIICSVGQDQIGKTIYCTECGSLLRIPDPGRVAEGINQPLQREAGGRNSPSSVNEGCEPQGPGQEYPGNLEHPSNFDFFRSYDAELLKLGEGAESLFPEHPNETATILRMLGERIAKSVAEKRGVDRRGVRSQFELLEQFKREDVVPHGVLDQFHTVRICGNSAAHDHNCTAADAEKALRAAYGLSSWFFREFADPTFEPARFVVPGQQHEGTPEIRPRTADRLPATSHTNRIHDLTVPSNDGFEADTDLTNSSEGATRLTLVRGRQNIAVRQPQFEANVPLHITMRGLASRNAHAQDVIEGYAKRHAGMDVAVGIVGLIPGMAIPALVGAIAAQGPIVYQPMARDLAQVYLSDSDKSVSKITLEGTAKTSALDIASEFGTEFMMEIGHEIVMEAGLGVLGSLCVPVLGGIVGAALDYLIANTMTWRVGTMLSIYFQNGATWLESRQETYEKAKELTGGISHTVREIIKTKEDHKSARVDLSEIASRVPEVEESQIRALKPFIQMMRSAMTRRQISSALSGQGVPAATVAMALDRYC